MKLNKCYSLIKSVFSINELPSQNAPEKKQFVFNASIRSNADEITQESLIYFGAVKKSAGRIILIDKSDEAILIIIRLHKIYNSRVSPAVEKDEIRLIPSKAAVPGYRYICLVIEDGTDTNL